MSQNSPEALPFPVIQNFEKFSYILYDRLYANLRLHDIFKGKFTIFINLINRANAADIKNEIVVFAGTEKQRKLLKAENDGLDEIWEKLKLQRDLLIETLVTGFLFSEAKRDDLNLNDFIKIGSVFEYFDIPKADWRRNQHFEHPILDKHFDISTAYFVGIPIYSFSKLQGAASIIFTKADYEGESPEVIARRELLLKTVCRLFMQEYDALVLDWDLETSGGSHFLASRVNLEQLSSKTYYETIDRNPILTVIGCREYYELSKEYLEDRIRENNVIPRLFLEEHRRRAIIAILIDSYAHNISAHSLTVLKWWFLQRGDQFHLKETLKELDQSMPISAWGTSMVDFLMTQFSNMYDRKVLEDGLQMMFARGYNQLKVQQSNTTFPQLPVRDQLFPLAKEMAPLFKFLLEKGAFWSGVTRDQQFGGEITNFFEILWEDFIKNPLYLGTIAYSEKITRLNLHVRIYEANEEAKKDDPHIFRRTYRIKSMDYFGQQVYLDQVLASIDVAARPTDVRALQHEFITKGEYFDLLKEVLEGYEVFFPGGVVGKHSFFTILENEIRNVKHFSSAEHHYMRENGLTLTIAFHPTILHYDLEYPHKAIYKIGVWLNHRTRMDSNEQHLLIKRLHNLRNDIITSKTNRAKLGGNYQDKICAAMLFNNTFISVQKGDDYQNRTPKDPIDRTFRDRLYYPWIKAAMSQGPEKDDPGTEHDFEISMKLVEDEVAQAELARHPKDETAYFKKYFHLWQGAFLLKLDRGGNLEVENVARFRIVQIDENEQLFREIRDKGVIRVLQTPQEDLTKEAAYRLWLQTWFGEKHTFRFIFHKDQENVSYLIYDKKGVRYFPADDYHELDEKTRKKFGKYKKHVIRMAHSENTQSQQAKSTEFVGIRSYGILAKKFFDRLEGLHDFYYARIKSPLLAYELAEAMATRLCIFDKRVVDRVPDKSHRKLLSDLLFCEIYGEKHKKWEKLKRRGLEGYHFIIMHLSFIETLTDKKGQRYGEKNIVRFIEDEIIALREHLGHNFLFIITTGRGRNQWWEQIKQTTYTNFVSFRPVESLIEAVESARMIKDDIELKYNLVKVLLGS
ncbi:MAG: hypothetical protein R2824_09750 [Saprospiraceae bacterium]|nr:hypothetical protein [Lewinella sp.]